MACPLGFMLGEKKSNLPHIRHSVIWTLNLDVPCTNWARNSTENRQSWMLVNFSLATDENN